MAVTQLATITLQQASTYTDLYTISWATSSNGIYYEASGSPLYLASASNQGDVFIEYGSTQVKVAPLTPFCSNSLAINLPTGNVTYSLNENASVQARLILDDGSVSKFLDTTGTYNFIAPLSASFTFAASGTGSWAANGRLTVSASKNGVPFFSGTTLVSGSEISSTFLVDANASYIITAVTTV